ncbi:hypothetical protein LO762_23135 [Actinocorallia sp. API 0066]|uniref:hypothetical protein n=1 Tax=Actinocorallia sp. API 0066 TaxID=2896846 RepID=UPI001E5F5490|nr:hypothetical protein [Actinocorallia sp. API 0066]MCD0452064.1 hypothetical protein [Actinocorallia sp. API 0066]
MDVTFQRTGERRYAVIAEPPGRPAQRMDPAPGYDEHIPHDAVHYLVEAELGLTWDLYGRIARGGGELPTAVSDGQDHRAHRRAVRRQKRKQASLRTLDHTGRDEMGVSEELATAVDLAWRRTRGAHRPDWAPPRPPDPEIEAAVRRVLPALEAFAGRWHDLPVGGSITFAWPSSTPKD